MDTIPLEIIHTIASVDMETFHALMTAYPRYSRSIPAVSTVDSIDRFDMMTFDVSPQHGHAMENHNTRFYYRHGFLHRKDDLPASICVTGESWLYPRVTTSRWR